MIVQQSKKAMNRLYGKILKSIFRLCHHNTQYQIKRE